MSDDFEKVIIIDEFGDGLSLDIYKSDRACVISVVSKENWRNVYFDTGQLTKLRNKLNKIIKGM